jgi:hypothetical protein
MWVGVSCTLAPKVNVSDSAIKTATTELSTGMEGAAEEFGSEVLHASKAQQEEFLVSVKELAAATVNLCTLRGKCHGPLEKP